MESTKDILFFEGPEKKVEILLRPGAPSLRNYSTALWSRVVGKAKAKIISRISNPFCDAFLLSESSLFVFDKKMVMITCGRTILVKAVLDLLQTIGTSDLELFIYERKDHHFPEHQPSDFGGDVRLLRGSLQGKTYRFGDKKDHHISLFNLEKEFKAESDDMTLEILMHGISDEARAIFSRRHGSTIQGVHEKTGIHRILPGYAVDDYLFDPEGYSLNAIRHSKYYTLHITPQEVGSYGSFETNHCFRRDPGEMIRRVLDIFKPGICNILFFQAEKGALPVRCHYTLEEEVTEDLGCGFKVQFFRFKRPKVLAPQKP